MPMFQIPKEVTEALKDVGEIKELLQKLLAIEEAKNGSGS